MKQITKILIILLTIVIFITSCTSNNYINKNIITRSIILNESSIDYQSFFNDFKEQKINYNNIENIINYQVNTNLDKKLLNNINFNNNFNNNEKINIFYLSIKEKEKSDFIIEKLEGIPFINEDKKIDIVFYTEEGVLYLSQLKDNGLINNVGWFSSLFKKIAKISLAVFAVAAVVAVAVVAAPVILPTSAVVVGTASASIMATAATTAVATSTLAIAGTTAAIALVTSTISYVISKVSNEIEVYNKNNNNNNNNNKFQKLTKVMITSLVKEATNDGFNTDQKKYVYLGRTGEYDNIEENNNFKNIIFKFNDIRWEELLLKIGKEGLWLINLAFLYTAYEFELKNILEFRLRTDYRPYENINIPIDEPGAFYSRELKFLRSTKHTFTINKINNSYYGVYRL